MTAPNPVSSAAFRTERELFERALDAPNGVRAEYPTYADAVAARARCNRLRSKLRLESLDIYPDPHPMRGLSPYEHLIVKIEGTSVVILPRATPQVSEL